MANEKRLIDANAVLGNYWKRVLRGETLTVEDLLYAIEHAPTVDATEVKRCKNCVACVFFDEYGIGWCTEHDTFIYEKDFCSYGKEK